MTIEDESAVANVIVWPKVFERVRPVMLGARYVAVTGRVQAESGVIHVVADATRGSHALLLARLAEQGADIDSLARADEVRRPIEDQREARTLGGRQNRLLRADARNAGAGRRSRRHRAAARRMRRTRFSVVIAGHHLAAPNIDAVGLERAVRLLHARARSQYARQA